MTAQREQLKAKLAEIHLTDCAVIDWGSGAKPAMRYIQHDGCDFTTIDFNPLIIPERRANHHIVHDITEPIDIGAYDVAFCLEVLEHVKYPQAVIENIYSNLKRGGKLYLSVPFIFPIHAEEDYWRFTEHGLKFMLGNFKSVHITEFSNQSGYWVEAIK